MVSYFYFDHSLLHILKIMHAAVQVDNRGPPTFKRPFILSIAFSLTLIRSMANAASSATKRPATVTRPLRSSIIDMQVIIPSLLLPWTSLIRTLKKGDKTLGARFERRCAVSPISASENAIVTEHCHRYRIKQLVKHDNN